MGDDLELNGGISLIPSSMHGDVLGACLIRAVDVLLSVVVNDVAHGVPNSGRHIQVGWVMCVGVE